MNCHLLRRIHSSTGLHFPTHYAVFCSGIHTVSLQCPSICIFVCTFDFDLLGFSNFLRHFYDFLFRHNENMASTAATTLGEER